MDPASAAVMLLAPYLAKFGESFAARAGEAALDGTKALFGAIRRKFSQDNDPYAQQTLDRLAQQPDDEGRQAALRSVLEEKANEDRAFAEQLLELVGKATDGQPVNNFLTQVYGGDVGKIVNIGTATTVNID
jgi:hypothetical protein